MDPAGRTGTNNQIISGQVLLEDQQMKVPQLRNMYRKVGADFGSSQGNRVGSTHNGAIGTLKTRMRSREMRIISRGEFVLATIESLHPVRCLG